MGYKLCMQPITSDAKFISVWRKLSSIIVEGDNDQSSYTVPLLQILALWASLLHAWHWWVVHRDIWERQEREDNSISEALGWFQWTFWKVRFTSVLLSKIGLPGWYLVHSVAVHKVRNVNHQLGFSIWNCRRLHPAMYLVALAYRSLDLEDVRRRQWNMSNFLQLPLSHILRLFKRIVNGHGEKKGVDWGHHENFCLGIIFLLYQLCLKLGVSVTPCFCFILSLKQLFVNVAM